MGRAELLARARQVGEVDPADSMAAGKQGSSVHISESSGAWLVFQLITPGGPWFFPAPRQGLMPYCLRGAAVPCGHEGRAAPILGLIHKSVKNPHYFWHLGCLWKYVLGASLDWDLREGPRSLGL